MKKIVAVILFVSCFGCERKIDIVDPSIGFSEEIQEILPDAILRDMRNKGMLVHEGVVPPDIEGIYYIDPYELLSPYGPEDFEKGYIIPGYYYKFSSQSTDKKKVIVDYTNESSDVGSGLGAFVSGYGKKFTVFVEISSTSAGIDNVQLAVISGELTESKEIKDFQYSFYMKEKNENPGSEILIPVNTGRIWFDNDHISERVNEYYGSTGPGHREGIGLSISGAGFAPVLQGMSDKQAKMNK